MTETSKTHGVGGLNWTGQYGLETSSAISSVFIAMNSRGDTLTFAFDGEPTDTEAREFIYAQHPDMWESASAVDLDGHIIIRHQPPAPTKFPTADSGSGCLAGC